MLALYKARAAKRGKDHPDDQTAQTTPSLNPDNYISLYILQTAPPRHSSTGIQNLPPELHLQIFEHLISTSDLLSLSRTSRYFQTFYKNHTSQIHHAIALRNWSDLGALDFLKITKDERSAPLEVLTEWKGLKNKLDAVAPARVVDKFLPSAIVPPAPVRLAGNGVQNSDWWMAQIDNVRQWPFSRDARIARGEGDDRYTLVDLVLLEAVQREIESYLDRHWHLCLQRHWQAYILDGTERSPKMEWLFLERRRIQRAMWATFWAPAQTMYPDEDDDYTALDHPLAETDSLGSEGVGMTTSKQDLWDWLCERSARLGGAWDLEEMVKKLSGIENCPFHYPGTLAVQD